MYRVSANKTVMVPVKRVWDLISDFGMIYRYHPSVKSSPIITKKEHGIGVKRQCEFYDKSMIVEEVTGWDEGRSLTFEIVEASKMPLKMAKATMSVSPIDGDVSEVTLSMDYVVKYGLIGRLMDLVMMKRMMRNMFHTILRGLDHHLLTGDLVGEGFPKK